jgi:hypothetical protein
MRRIGVCTIALALFASYVSQASATSTTTPVSAVVVASCHPSDDMDQRFATFVGQMQAVKGTLRMAMRFTLLERLDAPDFNAVSLTDLRPWRRSKRGVSSFLYTQRVTALRDGGTYRMRVQFRWYGSDGKVFKTKTMRSGLCHQPAQLPNLRVNSVTATPGAVQGTTKYTITLANDGSGDAGGVSVALRVDGGTPTTEQVPLVAAGKTASVDVTGPACQTFLRAVADPSGAIKETSEKDNSLVMACPS